MRWLIVLVLWIEFAIRDAWDRLIEMCNRKRSRPGKQK